jgi:hypothetical protein
MTIELADQSMEQTNPKSKMPALDPADDMVVREFDDMIAQQRQQEIPKQKAAHRELRILLWADIVFSMPIFICYIWLARGRAEFISLYMAIIATVVSAWGIYRALWGCRNPRPNSFEILCALAFAVLFLFYGTIFVTLTHRVDPDIEKLQSTQWTR